MGNEYEKLEKRLAAIVDRAMRRNLTDNGCDYDDKSAFLDALAAVKRDYELLTFHIGHVIERAMRDWTELNNGKVVEPIDNHPKSVRVMWEVRDKDRNGHPKLVPLKDLLRDPVLAKRVRNRAGLNRIIDACQRDPDYRVALYRELGIKSASTHHTTPRREQ